MQHPQVLVVYTTRAGYSRRVASAIARRLREVGCQVDLADLELSIRHPERYDGVVLGCAVRFGHPAVVMTEFIEQNRKALDTCPTAFFSIDSTSRASRHLDAFFAKTAWHPACSAVFPGVRGARIRKALEWIQDFIESPSVRHAEAPTDWRRVAAFADGIAALVAAAPRRPDEVRHGTMCS